MNKEDILLEIAHKNAEIKAIQSEINELESEYVKQYGDYQVGDRITANMNEWTKEPHYFECKKVVIKKTGTMDYKFKEIRHTLFTYDLKHLFNVQKWAVSDGSTRRFILLYRAFHFALRAVRNSS